MPVFLFSELQGQLSAKIALAVSLNPVHKVTVNKVEKLKNDGINNAEVEGRDLFYNCSSTVIPISTKWQRNIFTLVPACFGCPNSIV